MPRVTHVKSARKDNPVCSKGESYYWWKFRFGGKHFSLTYPKQSQLTQSPYLSVIYDCQDTWGELSVAFEAAYKDREATVTGLGGVADSMESVAENLRELVEQYEESASNVEEYFPGSEQVENLRNSGMECDSTCDEIDNMVQSVRDTCDEISGLELGEDFFLPEDADDDDKAAAKSDAIEAWDMEAQDLIDNIEFDDPNFDFHEV